MKTSLEKAPDGRNPDTYRNLREQVSKECDVRAREYGGGGVVVGVA